MAKVKTLLESINQLHLSIVWIKRWSFNSCVDSGDNSIFHITFEPLYQLNNN